jgi:hypothetical protein
MTPFNEGKRANLAVIVYVGVVIAFLEVFGRRMHDKKVQF